MSAFEYEAVPFNGYWWVIRTFAKGKFSRLRQFATEREARADLEATRKMIVRQIADAKAQVAKHQDWASNSEYWRSKGERPHDDALWLKDGWSGKR